MVGDVISGVEGMGPKACLWVKFMTANYRFNAMHRGRADTVRAAIIE